jgi:hypothetical protein
VAARRSQATAAVADTLAAFDKKLEALAPAPQPEPGGRGRGGRGGGPAGGRGGPLAPPDSLTGASAALAGVMNLLQGADVTPTTVQLNAIAAARTQASAVMARWNAIRTVELPAINAKLKAAGLDAIAAP